MFFSRRNFIVLVAAVLALVTTGYAQGPNGRRGGGRGPMYDTATEAVFMGTVTAIENVTPSGGGRGAGGRHLTFRTNQGELDTHLGPAAFLDEKKVAIAVGDTLEIRGSRITLDGKPVLLAREVRKGDQVWTLRDSSGRPLWSGRRR